MAQLQETWNKLNPRERLTGWGALAIAVGWVIGLTASYGLGGNSLALIGAIVVVVILYLKYAPGQSVAWPAPVPTIILVISAIVALGALVTLLNLVGFLGIAGGFFAGAILASLVTAAGAVVMVWGAWQEYQLTAAAPGPGPSSPTVQPPSASDNDDLPPA
ncbi:MAG TPA: hypothetical protein VF494_09305 [Candidatus Limnocylindrales bacterium]